MSAYQFYLQMQKAASLWINPLRTPRLQQKLLLRRIADVESRGVKVIFGDNALVTRKKYNDPHFAALHNPRLDPTYVRDQLLEPKGVIHIPNPRTWWKPYPGVDKNPGAGAPIHRYWGPNTGAAGRVGVSPAGELGAAHPVRQDKLLASHHELDEELYSRLKKYRDTNYTGRTNDSTVRAVARAQGREISEWSYNHADPGVILHESNRAGSWVDAATQRLNSENRRLTHDRDRMTMPYGKVIPVDGREWISQQVVMSSRSRPRLSESAQAHLRSHIAADPRVKNVDSVNLGTDRAAEALARGEITPQQYKALRQLKKEYGKSFNTEAAKTDWLEHAKSMGYDPTSATAEAVFKTHPRTVLSHPSWVPVAETSGVVRESTLTKLPEFRGYARSLPFHVRE